MILCLVTDRKRLAAAASRFESARDCLIVQARFAVDAGIELLQVRERDLDAAVLAALVSELLQITRRTSTRLLVNDRLDIALACGADGVHLRSDSISPTEARRIAPAGFLVGRSVHSVDEARAVVGADYLIAGTVFPSLSKPGAQSLIGVDGLRSIARSATMPVLAIGGITGGNIDDIARAGAAGCAAIGLFMSADCGRDDVACRAVPLSTLVDDARRRFDRVKTASSR